MVRTVAGDDVRSAGRFAPRADRAGVVAVRAENYQPFITHGAGGFLASLAPLFLLRGLRVSGADGGRGEGQHATIAGGLSQRHQGAALIFVLMSIVAFGVLPLARLAASSAPMAEVAAVYLPVGAAWFVTFGATWPSRPQ